MTFFKNLLFNIFRYSIRIVYYLLKPFLKENLVVIGGYKARYLSGNNEYLYNYLNSINPSFKYYLYTKDKNEYRKLLKENKNVIYTYKLITLIKLLKAKVLIVTTGPDDFSPFPLLGSKKVINLWHGIPIKTVGFPKNSNEIRSFNYFSKSIDHFTVSSDFEGEIIEKSFRISTNKIANIGLCKNDYFKLNNSEYLSKAPYLSNKIILYAPTFREQGMNILSFTELFDIDKLNLLLEKYNAYFLYRSHFNAEEQNAVNNYERIISASAREFLNPQPLLFYSDILVTDYSSIYFDFLLMDRPVIFYNYDYDEYKNSRDFLYSYEDNTPGPKVQTQDDLLEAIEEYLINPELDSEFRTKIKKRFHKHTDGKASERTYELIKELL